MKETWRPVPGYEGYYEVSNLGRVRSVTRTRVVKNRYGGKSQRTDKGCELSLIDNGNGYLYVSLRKDGHRENHFAHRLVALAFCDGFESGYVVNHKDENKCNNRSDNLEWVSQAANVAYSSHAMRKPKSVCKPSNTGEKYIRVVRKRGHLPVYRVNVRQIGIYKSFACLQDAIAYRNEVMNDAL